MPNVFLKVNHWEQEQFYSCLPACVRMILGYHGVTQQESSLYHLLGTSPVLATPVVNVARIAPQWDFEVSIGKFEIKHLKVILASNRLPIVVTDPFLMDYWEDATVSLHAVLIVGIDENSGRVFINDPFYPFPQVASLNYFDSQWSNKVVHTAIARKL